MTDHQQGVIERIIKTIQTELGGMKKVENVLSSEQMTMLIRLLGNDKIKPSMLWEIVEYGERSEEVAYDALRSLVALVDANRQADATK